MYFVNRLLCWINDVISISFKLNSEKCVGKASSFTLIYEILKEFPDLTLYMEIILGANYWSDTLKDCKLWAYARGGVKWVYLSSSKVKDYSAPRLCDRLTLCQLVSARALTYTYVHTPRRDANCLFCLGV